jgi:hypothetical protein
MTGALLIYAIGGPIIGTPKFRIYWSWRLIFYPYYVYKILKSNGDEKLL